MRAQVHAGIGPLADAASARGAQGLHARRGRPVGHQPICGQRSAHAAAHGALSGHAEGWAWANAGRAMQASNAAMVSGRPSRFTPKRLPLKICGTRQQSASVGCHPSNTPGASPAPAARRQQHQLALKGLQALAHPVVVPGISRLHRRAGVPVRYLSTRGCSAGGFRKPPFAPGARTRARARAWRATAQGGLQLFQIFHDGHGLRQRRPLVGDRAGTRASPTRLA